MSQPPSSAAVRVPASPVLQETKQYRETTEEKKLRFEALKKKDEHSAHEIARQNKKLDKLQVEKKVP